MLGPPGELPPHARSVGTFPVSLAVPRPAAAGVFQVDPAPSQPRGDAPATPLLEPTPAPPQEEAPAPSQEPAPTEPLETAAPLARVPAPAPPRERTRPLPEQKHGGRSRRSPRRRSSSLTKTLMAVSIALNIALSLELYRASDGGAPVTVAQVRTTPADSGSGPTSGASASPAPRASSSAGSAGSAVTPKAPPQSTEKRPKVLQSTGGSLAGVSLKWRGVKGATFYNVILWRDRARLLDLWPTAPRARIPGSWSYLGKNRRLEPGRYLWFVFAGYGQGANRRLGSHVASGDVVVRPG